MQIANLLIEPTVETLYMVFTATIFATVFGIPLGILLMVTDKGQILQNLPINRIFGTIVNVLRSIPLLYYFSLIPFTVY